MHARRLLVAAARMASTPNTMAGSVASQRKGDLRHYFGRSDGATAGRSGKRPRTIWETTIGSGSMEEAGLPSLSSADVTQMTTATLRDNINTAVDLELVRLGCIVRVIVCCGSEVEGAIYAYDVGDK